jgi:hypothetical protein
MALEFAKGGKPVITSDEEIWADENGKAVPFGDERGRTTLVGAGGVIDAQKAKEAGLTVEGGKATLGKPKRAENDEDEAKAEPAAAKAVASAPADKALKGPAKTK